MAINGHSLGGVELGLGQGGGRVEVQQRDILRLAMPNAWDGAMTRGDDFVFSRGDLLHKSSTDASSAACNKPNLGGHVDGD